jgi:hypothetical protein
MQCLLHQQFICAFGADFLAGFPYSQGMKANQKNLAVLAALVLAMAWAGLAAQAQPLTNPQPPIVTKVAVMAKDGAVTNAPTASTNAPAATTNAPAATTNAPTASTNAPAAASTNAPATNPAGKMSTRTGLMEWLVYILIVILVLAPAVVGAFHARRQADFPQALEDDEISLLFNNLTSEQRKKALARVKQRWLRHEMQYLEVRIGFFSALAATFVILGFVAGLYGYLILKKEALTLSALGTFGSYLQGAVTSAWSLASFLFIYVAFLAQKQQLIQQKAQLDEQRQQFHTQQQQQVLELDEQRRRSNEQQQQQALELDEQRKRFNEQQNQQTLELDEQRKQFNEQQQQQARQLGAQWQQFEAQQESMKRQSFEASFFQLLNHQNQITEQLETRMNVVDANLVPIAKKGRACFPEWYTRLANFYQAGPQEGTIAGWEISPEFAAQAYERFYLDSDHQNGLGHYFRTLYHVFRFVDDNKVLTTGEKRRYTSLVRAQLSQGELLVLFYNCVSAYGIEKFKPLVERYGLLENLNTDELLNKSHTGIDFFAESAYK